MLLKSIRLQILVLLTRTETRKTKLASTKENQTQDSKYLVLPDDEISDSEHQDN